MAEHNILGQQGEEEAAQFLRAKGYHILERNYRFHRDEIDIIAQKGDMLVAVEVKTRSSAYFGAPQDFVKPEQVKHMVRVLDHYIIKKDLDVEARFDIIAILKTNSGSQIEHLEDAFLYF